MKFGSNPLPAKSIGHDFSLVKMTIFKKAVLSKLWSNEKHTLPICPNRIRLTLEVVHYQDLYLLKRDASVHLYMRYVLKGLGSAFHLTDPVRFLAA